MHYLSHFHQGIDYDAIIEIHEQRQRWVNQQKKGFLRYRQPFERLSARQAEFTDCTTDTVTIGRAEEISSEIRQDIKEQLRCFMPWRKGPFSVFGIDIDAEWRSERKWNRLRDQLPDLSNKIVADIGCNNGYYMFRMVPTGPKLVLGFEPAVQHYYCFKSLNGMAGFDNLEIDLLGVEHLALFPEAFDVIFLMGIIYHHSAPIDILRNVHSALAPGGTLLIESQAIPGSEPLALFPERTYAKVPGTYFVPTATTLEYWLERAGFAQVEQFCTHPMNSDEQRSTEWMIFESYEDYIDPENPSLTVEGYPAPWRVFLSAVKR
ncbi:MAG: tRNA 5-methoxyuridine(34)/uridine 5-oxyacetic acid(34) synthase CmoB [Desulfobulbaceae bacterium]|nr:MAG: tRNA 5-methoxyuridine(34)/uridine 5-oxyacetic acid(34) synthase CmoB [Desulfobulbaceae bacterium]